MNQRLARENLLPESDMLASGKEVSRCLLTEWDRAYNSTPQPASLSPDVTLHLLIYVSATGGVLNTVSDGKA